FGKKFVTQKRLKNKYDSINDKFHEFALDFIEKHSEDSCVKFTHNRKWNETGETLWVLRKAFSMYCE
ncbi:20098_t:CDS:2, partial [Gigaspora margarita]